MIHLKDILVLKKKNLQILKIEDFEITKGEKILLSGDSGSGKSTLLKTILYFEKFEEIGKISFDNNLVNSSNLDEYRSNFSFINQKAPFFEGTSLEFLKLPFTLVSNSKNSSNSNNNLLIKNYLKKINLTDDEILSKEFTSLSGGEQQRLSIIQVLMMNRDILLLDEITSALDKTNRENVIKLILDDENGDEESIKDKTIIIVSHNNEEWLKTGKISKIVNIVNGEIKSSQVL